VTERPKITKLLAMLDVNIQEVIAGVTNAFESSAIFLKPDVSNEDDWARTVEQLRRSSEGTSW
jgi:hypothetical protein